MKNFFSSKVVLLAVFPVVIAAFGIITGFNASAISGTLNEKNPAANLNIGDIASTTVFDNSVLVLGDLSTKGSFNLVSGISYQISNTAFNYLGEDYSASGNASYWNGEGVRDISETDVWGLPDGTIDIDVTLYDVVEIGKATIYYPHGSKAEVEVFITNFGLTWSEDYTAVSIYTADGEAKNYIYNPDANLNVVSGNPSPSLDVYNYDYSFSIDSATGNIDAGNITASGNVSIGGKLGIGASPKDYYGIYVENMASTNTGAPTAFLGFSRNTPTEDVYFNYENPQETRGLYGVAQLAGDHDWPLVAGTAGAAQIYTTGGEISNVFGVNAQIMHQGSGSIANANVYVSQLYVMNSGSITNATYYPTMSYNSMFPSGTGTIGTLTGLHIEDFSGPRALQSYGIKIDAFADSNENDWEFYNAGRAYFGGNVGIGEESPQSKLTITGGDVYISSSTKGIIMKSSDESCARGQIDDSNNLIFTDIVCPE